MIITEIILIIIIMNQSVSNSLIHFSPELLLFAADMMARVRQTGCRIFVDATMHYNLIIKYYRIVLI